MPKQLSMPMGEVGAGGQAPFPRVVIGLTARPIDANPDRAIHSTAWAWNERAQLWQRTLSRRLYAQAQRTVFGTGWEAVVRVYGGGGYRVTELARSTGQAPAQAPMARVDQWAGQAAWGCAVPGASRNHNRNHAEGEAPP